MNAEKFYIIDDFYDDPDYVRQIALSSTYDILPTNNGNWVGVSTNNSYVVQNLDAKISKHVKFHVRTKVPTRNGFFRRSFQGETTRHFVHTDTPPGGSSKIHYTGVLYLTPPEYSNGYRGTNFYRHKISGKIRVDTPNEFNIMKDDMLIPDLWELTDSIDFVYNRMLLIHGDYFHSPGDNFGSTINDCTIKQIFAFVEI